MSKQESWEYQHETTTPFRSETRVRLSNEKTYNEVTLGHKVVCGDVGFGLSGEEAGNETKMGAVYSQSQLLGQI